MASGTDNDIISDNAEVRSYSLNITSQNRRTRFDFDISPRMIKAWLQQLPLGDHLEASRIIHHALHNVNRTLHPWDTRFTFLESIHETVNTLLTALNSNINDISFPISEKGQRYIDSYELLCSEMNNGYKITLSDYRNRLKFFQKQKDIALIIYRAVFYIAHSILQSHNIYSDIRPGRWEELNTLVLIASQEKVADLDISQGKRPPGENFSPITIILYQQLLMLNCASTSRLAQKNIQQLFKALSYWGRRVMIKSWSKENIIEATFVIEVNRDSGPIYKERLKGECSANRCLTIDTRKLVEKMSKVIAFCQEKESDTPCEEATLGVSLETIKHVRQAWKSLPTRHFQRRNIENNNKLVILSGLPAIHRQYAKLIIADDHPDNQGTDISYGTVLAGNNIHLFEEFLYSGDNTVASEQNQHHPWEILNESAGGFRIITDAHVSSGVRVGELLSIARHEDDRHRSIATIRWLNFHKNGDTELGMEVISPSGSAAIVQIGDNSSSVNRLIRALLLPELTILNQEESIILPLCGVRTGDQMTLIEAEQRYQIILGPVITQCETYARFRYERK
ncbi:MAG: hypothetical protein HQL49_01920 [Gammaproteobacteria bacterium]|nr:hypothetical protein [Gammaproteobacteria bacterium]